MARFNNNIDYDEDFAEADAFFEFAPVRAPPPIRPVNMDIMNDMDNFTIADLNDAEDFMPPREENDPYLDRDDVVQNIIQVMDNNLVLLQTAAQAQPTNMRLAVHISEFRSMRNAFMVHRQLQYLPEAVRDEEANEMTDLFPTLQEMRRLFLGKAACGGVTEDMLDDPDPNVCIRQPLVPGLEHSGTHHVVIRRKKGGKNKTFQWSHVAHYALYSHHLHSKDNEGHWVHCPDINDRRGVDLGHNCHVPDCINKWHINFEPWWLNAARNCCRYAGKCLGDRVHPGAIPCVFTEETMRVLRSERFPQVPVPPGVGRNKPGPRPGAPKTAKQAAYNTERRSASSKAVHQRKTQEQRTEEGNKRARSRKNNKEKKERNARKPAPQEVMEAVAMQHKVTSGAMPASVQFCHNNNNNNNNNRTYRYANNNNNNNNNNNTNVNYNNDVIIDHQSPGIEMSLNFEDLDNVQVDQYEDFDDNFFEVTVDFDVAE